MFRPTELIGKIVKVVRDDQPTITFEVDRLRFRRGHWEVSRKGPDTAFWYLAEDVRIDAAYER